MRRPDGWGEHEWAWHLKHGSSTDMRTSIEVPFPVMVDAYTQEQFDHDTILIRVGGGVSLRMWTEDALPYIDMLREVVARAVASGRDHAPTPPSDAP